MILVADASPLNFLVQLESEHLLQTTYSTVYVPAAVLAELRHPRAPEAVRHWAEHLPQGFLVRSLKSPPPSQLDLLGAGEREAIALALELRARTVLADDLQARNLANRLGLNVAGTLGVLRDAAYLGLVDYDSNVTQLLALGSRASRAAIYRARPPVR